MGSISPPYTPKNQRPFFIAPICVAWVSLNKQLANPKFLRSLGKSGSPVSHFEPPAFTWKVWGPQKNLWHKGCDINAVPKYLGKLPHPLAVRHSWLENESRIEDIFPYSKWGLFQPAMLVYQRVIPKADCFGLTLFCWFPYLFNHLFGATNLRVDCYKLPSCCFIFVGPTNKKFESSDAWGSKYMVVDPWRTAGKKKCQTKNNTSNASQKKTCRKRCGSRHLFPKLKGNLRANPLFF